MANLRWRLRQMLRRTGLRHVKRLMPKPAFKRRVPYIGPHPDGRPISFADLSEPMDTKRLPPLDQPGVDLSRLTPHQRSWHDQS
ncbi:hypothetical protein [Acidisoma silvae]|uniref:Uncharacterized protein n=1 Tax=Acidisoma silvae TaxID=2802396 RepID=A0A963YMT0_9PROT|nr:hypothetical protein [Acidisoma silvae]MCB8873716.1 hypothetical protein [Acidisoma silvae]